LHADAAGIGFRLWVFQEGAYAHELRNEIPPGRRNEESGPQRNRL